ncbi:MAG: formylglycine-generating enzyme family protein [Leptospira sp.]|nr:formylglycine-generating enzyme family protein [Leptospira sp.]
MGIEFQFIPPGEFIMGCSIDDNDCSDSEKPTHKIKISKGFYMGKYEVTQAQWKAVMGKNPSYFRKCGGTCPVDLVFWYDISDFLRILNELEGRENENLLRLPTEAEWEYAARAGTSSKIYAKNLDSIAWYYKNSGHKTHPVGKKLPNSFGLYDMIGNVEEWVEDRYDNLYYSISEPEDPKGKPAKGYTEYGYERVLRGCSWSKWAGDESVCRASARSYYFPSNIHDYIPALRDSTFGFRLVAPAIVDPP